MELLAEIRYLPSDMMRTGSINPDGSSLFGSPVIENV